MLKLRTRWRWIAIIIVLLVIAGMLAVTLMRRAPATTQTGEAEEERRSEPEAPPDLEKFRDAYTAGVAALKAKEGANAIRHLASFTFGPRSVEEYRLYYLANAYELQKNAGAQRLTLAKLMRRAPKLHYGEEAAAKLADLYAASGNWAAAGDVYAWVAANGTTPDAISKARWNLAAARMNSGDLAGAFLAARDIVIHHPRAKEAADANAFVRAVGGIAENAAIPLSGHERLVRAIALMNSNDPQTALEELDALAKVAGGELATEVKLQRGIALHRLRRYEDSNKVLEPLTGGAFKYAIPALRHLSRNYSIVSASINPTVYKTVKEKKRVGTVKKRVGKGKKRRTVTHPKYATVSKQIKLIDLAKKNKKDEYARLSSVRLRDLLMIEELDANTRLEVLNALIERAAAKNQDDYVRELVAQVVKVDPNADPGLQHNWDKAWAAYSRGDLATSRKLFRWISDTYSHPNIKRQNDYWYARTVERLGLKQEAQAIYRRLAAAPYADIYALHSVKRGAPRQENTTNPLKGGRTDWRELAEQHMPQELRLAYELTALSDMKAAQVEISRNERRDNTRFAQALQAEVYNSSGALIPMYRSLRRAWPQLATPEQDSVPPYFIRMYYPMKYVEEIREHSAEQKLDPHLVQALILQESYYNPKARSPVGATGLMQLMPPTAQEHSRKLRITFGKSRLENPDVNIRLGTFHLRMLINMFQGNTYLALASYNGGQGNVLRWRRAAPRRPMDEFLESIPFPETRGYVKRITMMQSAYKRMAL